MNHILRNKAAIFDMDGLLIDSEPFWYQSEISVLSEMGVDTSKINPNEVLGLRINQVVELYYQQSPWKGATINDVVDKIVDRTMEKIIEHRPLLPGVLEALEMARSLDMKIGLASASPHRLLNMVVELFDLTQYFDCISSAEYLPYSKPHPEVYLMTAEKLGVSPLQSVAFEDSLHGMIATKAARMRSVVVPNKEIKDDPRWVLADIKLDSLTELRKDDIL